MANDSYFKPIRTRNDFPDNKYFGSFSVPRHECTYYSNYGNYLKTLPVYTEANISVGCPELEYRIQYCVNSPLRDFEDEEDLLNILYYHEYLGDIWQRIRKNKRHK